MTDLEQWLDPCAVVEHAGAGDKRAVLAALAEIAGRCFGLPAPDLLERLLTREAQSSTGVGYGVALPHAALPGLDRMRAVFVRLKTPTPFDAVDGEPVDLVFALFDAGARGGEVDHLRALAKASRLLRGRDLRSALRQARSSDALYAILTHRAAAAA